MQIRSRSREEREREEPPQDQTNGQYGDQQELREEPQGVPPVLSRAHRGNQQELWDAQPILPRASWILQLTKEALRIMIDEASVRDAKHVVARTLRCQPS